MKKQLLRNHGRVELVADFWPMSTQKFPKQFQDILGTGRTMIQQTFDRIKQIVPTENIYVITNQEYVELSSNSCQKFL